MKTGVEGSNLSAMAARAELHYAEHGIQLPSHARERVFHVHEGTTGRNVHTQVGADGVADLMAKKPLRLRYSTQTPDGRLMEAVLLAASAQDALRLASVLVRHVGVPIADLTVVKEGTTRFHVVAGGIFRGLARNEAGRILAHLQPAGFMPSGPGANHHQQFFQAHIAKVVAAWRRMPPAALEEHLRKNTGLGAEVPAVIEFLAEGDDPLARLGSCPKLLEHLRKDALRATFPPFDLAKTLDNPLVPVPGSIWLPEGVVAQAIPAGGEAK